jgi:SAM-dependent methyltransferase
VTTTGIDESKADAFVGKALGDVASTLTVLLATIGDRVGMFRALDGAGPLNAEQVASRAGVNPRYATEWLAGMAAAGYLRYDPQGDSYELPPEHAPVLAHEGGPVFFAGAWQEITGAVPQLDGIAEAFRVGGGVPASEYGPTFWQGIERFTNGWFANQLLPIWIPAMPRVQDLLERGCDVADVGCGAGRALITLAQAYPTCRYVGYDQLDSNVARAEKLAADAGVADRVRFVAADVTPGLPDKFDVVFTFDVIHDAVDPVGLLRAIRQSLRPDGRYVCLDINASDRVEENIGPLGTVFYGFSMLYCMTTSLAAGGAGLGTCGFNEAVATKLGREAGFSAFQRVPIENPFNILYEGTP